MSEFSSLVRFSVLKLGFSLSITLTALAVVVLAAFLVFRSVREAKGVAAFF